MNNHEELDRGPQKPHASNKTASLSGGVFARQGKVEESKVPLQLIGSPIHPLGFQQFLLPGKAALH